MGSRTSSAEREPASITSVLAPLREQVEERQRRLQADPALRAQAEAARLEREREREREDLARTRSRRSAAGIPASCWPALEALDEAAPAVRAVRDFMNTKTRTFLLLHGPPGVGKTVAACAALDKGVPQTWSLPTFDDSGPVTTFEWKGRFVRAQDITRASTFDNEFWDGLAKVAPLVIDDLGTEQRDTKGWALGGLLALLTSRYDDARKTIITTNLSREAFHASYLAADGGRLADRLREGGIAEVIEGPSRRRTWKDAP